MPRFVILRHETQHGVHFDFMLECGGVLKTWSLPEPPKSGLEMDCQSLADHRLTYLDYEGPISGERGAVARWDCGTYVLKKQTDEEWALDLGGKKIAGRAALRRSSGNPNQWSFFIKP
jgi:hypothetical protein